MQQAWSAAFLNTDGRANLLLEEFGPLFGACHGVDAQMGDNTRFEFGTNGTNIETSYHSSPIAIWAS
nr:hypothetical protein OAM_17200 [Vibrio cyclitrophicus ZF14]